MRFPCHLLMLPAKVGKSLHRRSPGRRLTAYSTTPVRKITRASGRDEDEKATISELGDAARGLSATFCQGGSIPVTPGGLHLYFKQVRFTRISNFLLHY